jgi:hypothetical protein
MKMGTEGAWLPDEAARVRDSARIEKARQQFFDRFPWSVKRRDQNPSNRENEDQETELLFHVLERIERHARDFGNPCIVAVPEALAALAYDFWHEKWRTRGGQNNRPLQPNPKRLMQHWRDRAVRGDAPLPQDRGKRDAKSIKDTTDRRFRDRQTDDGFWFREEIDDREFGRCRVVFFVAVREALFVVYAVIVSVDDGRIDDVVVADETDTRAHLSRRSIYRELDDSAAKLSDALIEAPIAQYEYRGAKACTVVATKDAAKVQQYPKRRIGLRYMITAGLLLIVAGSSIAAYEVYPPFRVLIENAIAAIRSGLQGQRVGPISTLNDAGARPGERNEPWRALATNIGQPQSGVDPGEIARAMYETLVRTAPSEQYEPPTETDVELLSPNILRAVVSDNGSTSSVRCIANPNEGMVFIARTRNAPIRYSFGVYEVLSGGRLELTAADVGRPEWSVLLEKPKTYFIALVLTQVTVSTPEERAASGFDVIRTKHDGAAFLVFDRATNRHVFRPAQLQSASEAPSFTKGDAPGRFRFEGSDDAVRRVANEHFLAPALAQLSDYATTLPGCAADSVTVRAPGEIAFRAPSANDGEDFRVACFDSTTGAMETWDDAQGKKEVVLSFARPGTYGCAAMVLGKPTSSAPGRSRLDLRACWTKAIITLRH